MINPTGKKLEKIIFKLFDDASQGVDRYNHNGSLWLIFTNEMRWVVEYTKHQTLWYNYSFFKDEMELIGLDCVEDKDLIKKWFESRFLDMPKVEDAFDPFFDQDQYVEDVIQNGVRHTTPDASTIVYAVEDTIQNGVKDISSVLYKELLSVEDTIQNGVKNTRKGNPYFQESVEDTIKNGVKLTELSKRDFFPKDILQNGVKDTKLGTPDNRDYFIEDTIQNGVRMTKSTIISQDSKVEDTIKNGVKETHDDCSNNIARVEGIVRIGEKLN
jgi:hypothetical protein